MINLLVNTNPFCGLCLPIPEFGKAVQEQDRDATFGPGLHDMQADAICVYRTMFQFHGKTSYIQSSAIVTDKGF